MSDRGREAVARWRIRSGVWAAHFLAIMLVAGSLIPIVEGLRPNWKGVATLNLLALSLVVAAELMRRGSRVAACALLAGFLYEKGIDRGTLHEPLWQTVLWIAVFGTALANGVWGTVVLGTLKRERQRNSA